MDSVFEIFEFFGEGIEKQQCAWYKSEESPSRLE